jgi:hypothetical protein
MATHVDTIDVAALSQKFRKLAMPGMVKLIDYLVKEERVGRSVYLINCRHQTSPKILIAFGNVKGTQSVLLDIQNSFESIRNMPADARAYLDEVCAEIAGGTQQGAVFGEVEEVNPHTADDA